MVDGPGELLPGHGNVRPLGVLAVEVFRITGLLGAVAVQGVSYVCLGGTQGELEEALVRLRIFDERLASGLEHGSRAGIALAFPGCQRLLVPN